MSQHAPVIRRIPQFPYRPLLIIQLIFSTELKQSARPTEAFQDGENLPTLSDGDPHFPVFPRVMRASSSSTRGPYPGSAGAFPRHCTTSPRRKNICQLHLVWSVLPRPVSKSRLKGHPEMLFHPGPLILLCS